MRIALLYFGKTRSIRKTYNSHFEHIYEPLKAAGIDYDIYLHTWKTNDNMIWDKECNVPNDDEEYKLLNPEFYRQDVQAEFQASFDFSSYFDKEIWDQHGDNRYYGEWRPQMVMNHLCALESERRVFQMCEDTGRTYDYYIVLRPDALFTMSLNLKDFLGLDETSIAIPEWKWYEGYNDRFAIGKKETIRRYTNRGRDLAEFRKTHGRIVAEKNLKLALDKYRIVVKPIKLHFDLCRP